jgi:hypothetical protein
MLFILSLHAVEGEHNKFQSFNKVSHVAGWPKLESYKKGKAIPQHIYGGAGGERMYSSYSFMTSALDEMSGQRHAPAMLYPRVEDLWYPLYSRMGGPQTQRLEEIYFLLCRGLNFFRPVFQSVARHYTD